MNTREDAVITRPNAGALEVLNKISTVVENNRANQSLSMEQVMNDTPRLLTHLCQPDPPDRYGWWCVAGWTKIL